jgi:hypothetical protein
LPQRSALYGWSALRGTTTIGTPDARAFLTLLKPHE